MGENVILADDMTKVRGFIRLPKKYTDKYENRPPSSVERRFLSEYLFDFLEFLHGIIP